jgi:HPt (histidine-containing phosphotransfer) domain-containing protein
MPADDVIDLATYRELQATAGSDFVVELVDTFLEEAPTMLAALHAAQATGDAESFRRAAHSLKSNSLTFGALALGAAARALELGGIGDPADVKALMAEYGLVAEALRRLRDA